MKKLHIERNGQWLPVFCNASGRVITCQDAPHKALPSKSFWGMSDLAYFSNAFGSDKFELRTIEVSAK